MIGPRVLTVAAALVVTSVTAQSDLPTVDLGYAVHLATVNDTGFGYYNFSNIRYAAPPTGDNRFLQPVAPTGRNSTVNDGQQSCICNQAFPLWGLTANQFVGEYLSGVPIETIVTELQNQTSPTANLTAAELVALIPAASADTSEDCLFLDVIVPKSTFAAKRRRASTGAPVLVWIHGGGYTEGSKASAGNPATLISKSLDNGGEGIVFVAINYRLGLFGWLSGPTFQASGGTANAGLYDQRLAFEWIQSNIHLFGGDPSRVTVMGESAGGSSILHQITAYGGANGDAPFSQAILQSPAFLPLPSQLQQETIYQTTLGYASAITNSSITTLAGLRSLSFQELYYVSYAVVALSSYSSFTFGPTVDGTFVPKLPGQLLLAGLFDHNLKVMVGHNSNEGLYFTNPLIQNETAFVDFIKTSQPEASDATVAYIADVLYPADFSGAYGYTNQLGRTDALITEFSFTCNTRFVNTAFDNETHSYFFAVPPGLHAGDVAYTFFNGDTTTSNSGLPVDPAVANAMQEYLTSFAQTGDPNEAALPYFPVYGANSSLQVLGLGGALGTQVTDETANPRCDWWQLGLYYTA